MPLPSLLGRRVAVKPPKFLRFVPIVLSFSVEYEQISSLLMLSVAFSGWMSLQLSDLRSLYIFSSILDCFGLHHNGLVV